MYIQSGLLDGDIWILSTQSMKKYKKPQPHLIFAIPQWGIVFYTGSVCMSIPTIVRQGKTRRRAT